MPEKYPVSLFIFRRDFRLQDNSGLISALESSEKVIPSFIFDPRLLDTDQRNENAIQFLLESLKDLEQQLSKNNGRLYVFYDRPEKILNQLLKIGIIKSVFVNRDYTVFSKKRDNRLKDICQKNDITFNQYADSLLNEPEMVLKADKAPYQVFTPYYRKASQISVSEPSENTYTNYYTSTIPIEESKKAYQEVLKKPNEFSAVHGGRTNGLKILKTLEMYLNYEIDRDYPSKQGTTKLSAHIKLGTCSIREIYHAIKKQIGSDHPLIRQLYWRDFFTQIAFYFPYVFKKSFRKNYEKLPWRNDPDQFKAWCEGRTGFPIVDAGMRELNTTGYMHNRIRMIIASFLTKDLHIDWRWGERYFARKLIDYDPCVNNGNWQWAASTGCDAQPYFRIFNPWLQQKKYDSSCEYIKKWIPELKEISNKLIHTLFKQEEAQVQNYPPPIVDHSVESRLSKEIYRNHVNSLHI
ncbi:MAG: cryptochrome/photolyase family protein [Promethearchaeota archaeon]